MPMDREKYPVDWDQIARAVKEDAGWKCEVCGMGHMEDGTMGSCLTVHHPDRDPGNAEARLMAACARCHLEDERMIRRRERNRDQLSLFI